MPLGDAPRHHGQGTCHHPCPPPALSWSHVPRAGASLVPRGRIQATSPAWGDLIAISISASIGFLLGLSFYVS